MSDPRFARLRTDPRFRRPKKSQQKVVIDERFKALFNDDANKKPRKRAGRVDKYGRPISDTREKDNLRRFYRLEHGNDREPIADDAEESKNKQTPAIIDYARGQVLLESSDEEGDEETAKEEHESDLDDGEVVLGSHASKPIPVLPEADEYLEVDLNEDDAAYADLDAQVAAYTEEHTASSGEEPDRTGTKTNRIAVVNLDWDHVRASHLYKVFSSLVSPTAPLASVVVSATPSSVDLNGNGKLSNGARVVRGKVLSVRVYPSEFGKERMKKEEVEGPPKEIFKKSRREDVLLQEDEGDPFDEKALRKYQLERLRYFYAVVTCDTVEAAAHIFTELDGAELESTANVFDLSFVPDDMTFDDDFRDEATPTTEAFNSNYKPLDFTTDALRHSKVTLKWDEDDPEWNKITRRTLSQKEIEEGDFRAYIASSSSEDEDEGTGEEKGKEDRSRLRQLLLGSEDAGDANPFADEDKGAEGDVEITFMPGLSEANAQADEETTIEKYKRKQKEKRLARKKEKKENEKPSEKKKKAVYDDFFAAGSESEGEEEQTLDVHKDSKTKKSSEGATEAELELLAAPDDLSSSRNHFDMKAVLKAEKAKSKKGRKKNKKKGADNEDEVQEEFQIDVKDERFKALHEDHTFAIDPSNPHFKKTKSMAALLEERLKRQSGKEAIPESNDFGLRKSNGPGAAQSLENLVESVKRKSSQGGGKGLGKRRKL